MTETSTTTQTEPLDPIGYDDALLVGAALRRFADYIADQIASLPEDDSLYREAWTRDLIRVRWLSGRSWYGATLSPARDANDREDAMRQLEVIAAGVSA